MPRPDIELPPVNYRRGEQPMLKRLAHPFKAPFTDTLGGPLLDDCDHRQIDCSMLDVELYIPKPAFGTNHHFPKKGDISLDSTFSKSDLNEDRTNHFVFELSVTNWLYFPPRLSRVRFLPIPQEPYVVVTAYWNLERVKNGIQLEVGNTEMLEQYLRDDYYAFLESEGGHNWTVRKDITEEYGPAGRNSGQETVETFIAAGLFTPPRAYETLVFNGQPWLRYNWAPQFNYPKGLMYTTVLTPNTLFTVYFGLTQMIGGSIKQWWSELVEDTEIVMQGVKVHYKDLPPGTDRRSRQLG